jgi:hypothetical protein
MITEDQFFSFFGALILLVILAAVVWRTMQPPK